MPPHLRVRATDCADDLCIRPIPGVAMSREAARQGFAAQGEHTVPIARA